MTIPCGRITFSGLLDEADRLAFSDFDIQTVGGDTVLIGELDQPTLVSVTNRLRPLGRMILSLDSEAEGSGTKR